jgi:hypothetical protein
MSRSYTSPPSAFVACSGTALALTLLNCDVSATEIPVQLQEETREKVGVLRSSKYSDLLDVDFKMSEILGCGLTISDILHQ